MSKQRKKI